MGSETGLGIALFKLMGIRMGAIQHTFRLLFGQVLALLLLASPVLANDVADGRSLEQKAQEALAQKLLKLGQSVGMKERSYPESAASGAKDYDADSGNSFGSDITEHSYVHSVCTNWVGPFLCDSWVPPYISLHGFQKDASALETRAAQEWQRYKDVDQGNQFAIWNIEREGGNRGTNKDAEGKLDLEGVTSWRIRNDVKKNIENVGTQAAVREMVITYDENSGKGDNTMPNMESLRLMASRLTKQMRNRFLTKLGQYRASQKPIEFSLSEEMPDCEAYVAAMKTNLREETGIEERLKIQGRLDPETAPQDLQERYKMCVQMRKASAYMVNPEVRGDKVQESSKESENIMGWANRMNLYLIDNVGANPNKVARPSRAKLLREDITSEVSEHNAGGLSLKNRRRLTNAQVLQQYANQLESAAVGMEEVAMRSPNIVDNSNAIRKYKIKPGQMNAVKLNSLTGEMRRELASTSFKKSAIMKREKNPENNMEDKPSELTVTKR